MVAPTVCTSHVLAYRGLPTTLKVVIAMAAPLCGPLHHTTGVLSPRVIALALCSMQVALTP